MTWEIFLGIVAIIGFVISIITPITKLIKTMSDLSNNITNLNAAMNTLITTNTEDHRRIWKHEDEQDAKIENHEHRLIKLETKENP